MNTTDTSANSQIRIGLIELPDLADALTRLGLNVVTGPDFRSAATGIRNEFSSAGAFPIVVGDTPAPGLRAWVERIQQSTPVTVAVIRNPEHPVVVSQNVIELTGPLTLNSILAAVGLPAAAGGEGSYPEAPATPAGLELPDFDDLVDEPAAPAVQAPVAVPAAEPEPAEAPVPMTRREQRMAQQAAEAAEAAARAVEQPAPAEDPWGSAPVQQQAEVIDFPQPPADAVEEDPFEQTPTAAEETNDWDTPAPFRFQTPGPQMAAPSWEAQSTTEDDWDSAPQVQHQPAPVFEAAPAVQDEPMDWDSPAPAQQPGPQATQPAMPAAWEQHDAQQRQHQPVAQPRALETEPAEDYFDTPTTKQPVRTFASDSVANPFTSQPAPVAEDASAVFDDFEASKLHGSGRSAGGLAALVINYSGKGGVGKSTSSLQLAKVASDAGLRVILIDGNSGQGDLRTYLRLNKTDLPTIYDAAIGSVRDAVLVPDVINSHRDDGLGKVNFAFVAAPPDDINDPAVVTDEVYRSVIEFARRNADIVIIDTQIVESADRTGVVTSLWLPALVHDAWGIGVADMTNVGVNNLNSRLRKFINEGAPTDRLMVLLNRVHPEQLEMAAKAVNYFRGRATFLGAIEMDTEVAQSMNAGRIDVSNQNMRTIMSKALLRITGNEAFRGQAEEAPAQQKKTGLFARLLGRAA